MEQSKKKQTLRPLRILMYLVILVGVYFFLPQLGAFKNTFGALRHTSIIWLIIGLVASAITFLAAAVTQFAAGNPVGKLSEITLLQLAGDFVNHFLPFSFGGINLNAQYYRKHGASRGEAVTIATIPIVFGVITTLLMVAAVSPITLSRLVTKLRSSQLNNWELTGVIVGVIAALALITIFRHKVLKYLQDSWKAIRSIVGVKRIALLVGGSIGITLFSTVALMASVLSVHGSITLVAVFVIYVSASLAGNIAPTPGGIGAIEAVIALELVAAHVSLPEAAASTLIFRLFTFWLPTIPEGFALRYVRKKNII
jgi:uncharacterized membrane protein YbhN (UPF0104 family)